MNDLFRRLVERSPVAILVCRDDAVAYANVAAASLFGVESPERLQDLSFLDSIVNDGGTLVDARARWRQGQGAPPVEGQILRGGELVDIELVGSAVDDEGRTIQLVVRDITARKRADAALHESEERLSLAFAGAQEGVWDWNLETNAVVYSSRWKEMLGYADDEVEPHISAWERLVHPDDRPRADRANESVAHGEPTYEAEFRLRHKQGHYVHVLSRGFPIRRSAGDAVVRIVGTHFDLTEQKRTEAALRESQERLQLAFEGAQEGVWDWNIETGAVVYSARWKQMLGYRDDEIESNVSAWERLVHPDDRHLADRAHDSVLRGSATYEAEFRLRHKDGHYVHVLSRGFPVRREPGGPVVRIVGTHFDLTERKNAEELLRRSHEELERRVDARTIELASANASLRAEMQERERAERARTELLTRLVFAQEDERRRIAREMHDQFGEHLTALEHNVLALKHACAGEPALAELVDTLQRVAQRLDRDVDHLVWELRPTALDDLGLRAALANYAKDWSGRVGVTATLHTSGLVDDRLAPDAETTLFRIAQEALTNIAKHAKAAHVDIILERRDDHVLLIVEDDGVGFEPGASQPRSGGGFGLLGMQERAGLVNAVLEIESAPDQGTTVLVRMPARTTTTT